MAIATVDLSAFFSGVKVTKFQDRTEWSLNGERHRVEGPAVEYANGIKCWYQNGKLHRLEGPAIEYADGTKEWYRNGQRHRVEGTGPCGREQPAIEDANGTKHWYQNHQLHRVEGPAIECTDGTKYWYLEGIQLTESEFIAKTTGDTANKKLPVNDIPIKVCANNSSVDEVSTLQQKILTLQQKIKELELENCNLKITIKVISKVLTH